MSFVINHQSSFIFLMSWRDIPIEEIEDRCHQDLVQEDQDQSQEASQSQGARVEDARARRTRMLYETLRARLMSRDTPYREDEPPWESCWGD